MKRRVSSLTLSAAFAGLAGLAGMPGGTITLARAAEAPAGEPPRIEEIEVRSDTDLGGREAIRDLVALTPGEPLQEAEVRRTLRNFQASGLTSKAAVYTRPAPGGGVVAVVALWANMIVREVRLEGDLGVFSRAELSAALEQREGEPLVEDRVVRSDFRLEELLAGRGYLESRVGLDVEIDEKLRQAVVTFEVRAGRRATVGEVRFHGELGPFEEPALAAVLKARPGEPYRRETVRDDADRLRSWLIREGYRVAAVEPPREEIHRDEARVDVLFSIRIGPLVRVEVEGADLRRLRQKGLLPFLEGESYDEALLLQSVDRIRSFFQRQGFYRVEVEGEEERVGDELAVRMRVERGQPYELDEIRFEGNEQVSDERLSALLETSAKGFLSLGSGRLVDEVLDADLSNLRSAYALDGFTGFEIGPERVVEKGRKLRLIIPIFEGRRRTVGKIDFRGFFALDPEKLRDEIDLHLGGPFHPLLLEESLADVRSRYNELGFPNAQVSSALDWNPEGTRVEVRIQVFEGTREVIGRIIVRGNGRTHSAVIRRALGVRSGEPVSGAKLLEMERNLYRLGIFSRVEVSLTPAELGIESRDVVVRVEEGRTRTVIYGLGYDSDDGARGSLGFSNQNVGGLAHTLRFDTQVSSRDQRFRLLFDQPHVRDWPIGAIYELFRFEENRESYEALRWVGRVEAVGEIDELRLSLLFDYRWIGLSDFRDPLLGADGEPLPGILSPFEEEDEEVRVASLIPNLLLDHRDDPLDPTAGWSTSARLQYSFPFAGAEPHFVKLFGQQTGYLDIGKAGVVAGSVRMGVIEPLDSPPAGVAEAQLTPLDERFFAGGRTSHRAYRRFELGIPESTLLGGEPIGGNGLLLLNAELRFPVAGPLGGTVFIDSGNVWSDWRDFRPGDLKTGAGIGVRYSSPIGPLRLEVGWKLDQEEGEDGAALHFSFGHPF